MTKNIGHSGRTIRDEIRTTATPQQVWEAWTHPEKLAQWFVDRATSKPEVGTTFTWFFDQLNYTLPYEVIAAEPGERFALRWPGAGAARPAGILDVLIERDGGITKVRLVNSGFQEGAQWDEEYLGIASGWTMALATLRHYLENYFGKPRTNLVVMRPAQFSYTQLAPSYRDAPFLARWLTISGEIGSLDEPCMLQLRDGGKLTGRVLARTSREVAVSWREILGLLQLKAFSASPGQQRVCLQACAWNLDPTRAGEIERQMESALIRLAAALGATAAAG